jgi:hypothetical protein
VGSKGFSPVTEHKLGASSEEDARAAIVAEARKNELGQRGI